MKRDVAADKEAVLEAITPGAWFSKAEVLAMTGLDKVNYVLDRLIIEKRLIARGATTSRQWALTGTPDVPPGTLSASAPRAAEDPPAADAPAPEDFIPAMATDRRMVLVRRGVAMILTTEETQAVADLIFQNFEAA